MKQQLISKPIPLGDLVDIALKIAEERARVLEDMKQALASGDDQAAIRYARQLCGLRP